MHTLHSMPQRGGTLIEALISLLLVCMGVVVAYRLQGTMQVASDLARQRSEAIQLAERDLEAQRAFATLDPAPGFVDYRSIASASTLIEAATDRNADFEVARMVDDSDASGLKVLAVDVSWHDRRGEPQAASLQSIVSAEAPSLAAALNIRADDSVITRRMGRSAFIPPTARALPDGRLIDKPSEASTFVWVFDPGTGRVVERCTATSGALAPTPSDADLRDCEHVDAWLLSGVVRMSLAIPPDPKHAIDMPLTLGLTLHFDGMSSATTCLSEPRKELRIPEPGGRQLRVVPLSAPTPAGADETDRYVAYQCLTPATIGGWSGRSDIVPSDWLMGMNSTAYRVCRYSADQDRSGAVDSNAEHPAHYERVRGPLQQQNFLIVRGDQTCPASADRGTRSFVDHSTMPHQP